MSKSPESTSSTVDQVLGQAQDEFIATWGQMGSSWGIPRTMAEVHALLYITDDPLNTDQIMKRLEISRGNASMSVRSLVEWGIVQRVHRRGDRKEYFTAERDVWQLFRTIVRERKKREIDPVIASLRRCRELTESLPRRRTVDPQAALVEAHNSRLDEMLKFMETIDRISTRFISPQGVGLETAAKLLSRVS